MTDASLARKNVIKIGFTASIADVFDTVTRYPFHTRNHCNLCIWPWALIGIRSVGTEVVRLETTLIHRVSDSRQVCRTSRVTKARRNIWG